MEDKLHDVLSGVNPKQSRSRLEPYGEFVEALGRQGFTCRDIAALLAEKCHFETSKSAVHSFVRARARRRRNAARQSSRSVPTARAIISTPRTPRFSQAQDDDEVRQRIAALKARKPAETPSCDGFNFNPDEPLWLIDPEKRDSHN
jgi:hypothetical protein